MRCKEFIAGYSAEREMTKCHFEREVSLEDCSGKYLQLKIKYRGILYRGEMTKCHFEREVSLEDCSGKYLQLKIKYRGMEQSGSSSGS